MKITYRVNDPWDGEALSRKMHSDQAYESNWRCLSVLHDGELAGGVIYTNFNVRSVQIHVAAFTPKWLTRDFLWMCFDWPFNRMGVDVVYGPVDSSNDHALQFDLRLGFVEEARLVGGSPTGDIVILSMRRHQCRWLNYTPRQVGPPPNEQRLRSPSGS